MCGIAGILDTTTRRPPTEEAMGRLLSALAHRGPDAAAFHIEGGIGLAATRLAIVDHDGGRQPLTRSGGAITVVFNGEIDDHGALRASLERMAVHFATRSDTEVLAAAYEAWGTAAFDRLRGMYAAAILDRRKGTLTLVRDPVGEKPLYVAETEPGTWAFASEMQALVPLLRRPPTIDRDAVADLVALGAVSAPRTVLREIRALLPGERRVFRLDGAKPPESTRRNLHDCLPKLEGGDDSAALESALRTAVARCMKPGVPTGLFLSGGIDSAIVAGFAREHAGHALPAWTIAFDDPGFDESPVARAVAARIGLDHRVVPMPTPSPEEIDALAATYGDPFADASAFAFRALCEVASRDVRIALAGDGGDEGFAGYDRHRAFALLANLRGRPPSAIFDLALRAAARCFATERRGRLLRAWNGLSTGRADGWFELRATTSASDREELFLDQGLARAEAAHADFRSTFDDVRDEDALRAACWADLTRYLPDDLCVKSDRASMAFGLEVRAPFLDLDVLALATAPTRTPDAGWRAGKRRLRALAARFMPRDALSLRKRGFAVPLARWLRGPLRPRLLELPTSPRLLRLGLFREGVLDRWVAEHLSGHRDRSAPLFALAALDAALARLLRD